MTLEQVYLQFIDQAPPKMRSVYLMSWPKFAQFCGPIGLEAVTSQHLRDFHQDLLWRTGDHGALYKPNTIDQILRRVRQILRWAFSSGLVQVDPSQDLLLPRPIQPSRQLITWDELQLIFATFDTAEPHGLRDAALFGVVCETEMAMADVLDLKLWQATDLQLEESTARILARYLDQARPILAGQSGDEHLFLGRGRKLGRQAAHLRLQRAVRAAGISGQVLARTLRLSYQAHLERQLDRRLISF
jgi:site-specific recombinase XerD